MEPGCIPAPLPELAAGPSTASGALGLRRPDHRKDTHLPRE